MKVYILNEGWSHEGSHSYQLYATKEQAIDEAGKLLEKALKEEKKSLANFPDVKSLWEEYYKPFLSDIIWGWKSGHEFIDVSEKEVIDNRPLKSKIPTLPQKKHFVTEEYPDGKSPEFFKAMNEYDIAFNKEEIAIEQLYAKAKSFSGGAYLKVEDVQEYLSNI